MKKSGIAVQRLLASLVAAVFLFGGAAGAVIDDVTGTDYEMELVIMRDLGVMSAYEDGSLRPTQAVSRAEFTNMVIRLLGLDKVSLDASFDGFSDVGSGYWAYDNIAIAYTLGIISASEEGLFYPEKNVTLQQAIKMLVCALGYGLPAEQKGGWPSGYIVTAGSLNLMKKLKIGMEQELDRQNAALLLYNTLDVKILTESEIGKLTQGGTLFEEKASVKNWVKSTGILTTNYDTDLVGGHDLEPDEVIIDGNIYHIGATAASQYLGQRVTFYSVEETDGSEKRLLSVYPDKGRNTVLEFDASMLEDLSAEGLSYYEAEDKDKNAEKISFAKNVKLIVNGQWINGFTEDDFSITEGGIRVIDNDGDLAYDVLVLNRSASFLVDRVSTRGDLVYLKNASLNGRRSIITDTRDKDLHLSVIKDGQSISVTDIQVNDAITVYASPDGKRLRMLVSGANVDGVLSEINLPEGELGVDGTVYPVAESFKASLENLKMGTQMRFYLDANGKVAYATDRTQEASANVGYLMGVEKTSGLGSTLELKVLFGGRTYEVEDKKNKDNDKTITEVKNSDIRVLKTAQKLKLDGKSMTAAEAAEKLAGVKVFTFKKNDADEVTAIETAERFAIQDKRAFNKDIKSFGGTTNQAFQIDDTTDVILYAGSSTDDDYFVSVQIKDGSQYTVEGYGRRDDNGFVVDTLVLYDPTMVSVVGTIDEDTPASIVTAVTLTLGSDGEEYRMISCYTDGKAEKKEVKETVQTNAVIDQLKAGSVIKYTDDSYGRIDNIALVSQLSTQTKDIHTDEHGANEKILAKCMKVEAEQLSNTLNEIVDVVYLSVSGTLADMKSFNVPLDNGPAYYIYRQKNNAIEPANAEYLRPAEAFGETDAGYAFIHRVYDEVKIVVIFE